MVNKISTCLIPAAGRGSRWAPVSGYLPKEMLPLIDKPVIEWVIEESIQSGIHNFIIVINTTKDIIKDYILNNKKLRKKADFNFVYQNEPKGLADVIHLSKKHLKEESFAMALPDLPTISKVPVLKQLIKVNINNKLESHIVSFSKFPPQYLHLYSECKLMKKSSRLFSIKHFCSKISTKSPHHIGNKVRMSGRYIFNSSIFESAEQLVSKKYLNELSEVDVLNYSLKTNNTYAYLIQGHTYDTGTPYGYVRANTAFFKKNIQLKI